MLTKKTCIRRGDNVDQKNYIRRGDVDKKKLYKEGRQC
jgi:hypothetical protein